MVKALKDFREDVEEGVFPAPEHCYGIPQEEVESLQAMLKERRDVTGREGMERRELPVG